jgi:hypothetical protein
MPKKTKPPVAAPRQSAAVRPDRDDITVNAKCPWGHTFSVNATTYRTAHGLECPACHRWFAPQIKVVAAPRQSAANQFPSTINHQPSTFQWTPVTPETMPDTDITVLIACPHNAEPVWFGYWDSECNHWRAADGLRVTVTHWQHLPEPPSTINPQPSTNQ